MSNLKVAMLATAALAASSVVFVAQPASGALVTRCTGDAGAVTVPNDLVVPAGRSCALQGTTVQGNVRVAAGADLLLDGATVAGSLTVVNDGYADVIDSSIGGSVLGRSQFGVFIENSAVAGDISQRNPRGEFAPFVYTLGGEVAGKLDARAGQVLLESATVGGDVLSRNGEFTDLVDSVVGGALTVSRNSMGSVVCESEVYGPAVYDRNGSVLQIGGSGSVGPCEGASYWGGDVTFTDNTADENGLSVSNNIVAGNLSGAGNEPGPTGEGNRVRGEVSGQFVDLMPAAAASERRAFSVAEERSAQLMAKIEQRRGAAEKDAAATPPSEALTLGNG